MTEGSALVLRGDALHMPLPDNSVDLIITSPPYFALRSYRDEGEHYAGQIGSEETPQAFLEALWAATREMKRVLKPTGSMFINLGDKYAGAGMGGNGSISPKLEKGAGYQQAHSGKLYGFRPKSLMGLPWRYALGCIDDLGLILRAEIIWQKPNGLPECLDPSTRLFIRRDGWVSRVELDALVGMAPLPEILGPNGWVQVRQVWETEKAALYFQASKVESVICGPEHLFPVSSERRSSRFRELPAKDIRHEGYADYLLYAPIDRFLEPSLTHFGGWPLDETTGYLVGVYAAEGGFQGLLGTGVKLTIGAHELDFAERIRLALKACGVPWREALDRNALMISVNHDRFLRLVAGFVAGTVKRKVLSIDLILNAPEKFRRGVLNGYVEGDGSDRKGGGWIAGSASRQLRDDISTLASSVGIITSKKQTRQHDKRTGNTYTSWHLWTPYITKRKTKTGMEGIYQVPPRARSEGKGGVRRMIDLEVDGGLFLIGDGLVTHNSVQDRVRRSHEQWFMFTKSPKYFAAVDEIREPSSDNKPWGVTKPTERMKRIQEQEPHKAVYETRWENPLGKLPGSVWRIPSEPLLVPQWAKDKYNLPDHFAAFPQEWPRRLILGWSPSGVCEACGEGRRPVVERKFRRSQGHSLESKRSERMGNIAGFTERVGQSGSVEATITGYACNCPEPTADTKPAVILDVFGGTGTVAMVARALGRDAISLDLSMDYSRLAQWRIHSSGHGAKALSRTNLERQGTL